MTDFYKTPIKWHEFLNIFLNKISISSNFFLILNSRSLIYIFSMQLRIRKWEEFQLKKSNYLKKLMNGKMGNILLVEYIFALLNVKNFVGLNS